MNNAPLMSLPPKALESEQGRVITFDSHSAHSPHKSGLLALIARELMQTQIATDEAAWPTNPTVLVITDSRSAEQEVEVFKRVRVRPLEDRTAPATLKLQNRVYGNRSLQQEGITREVDFLNDILVEENIGLSFYEFPSTAPFQTKKALLRWARKYFDFILVEHRLIASIHKDIPDYFLVAPQVDGEKVVHVPASEESKNIDICQTAHGLARSKHSLRIPSYFVKKAEDAETRVKQEDADNNQTPVYFDTKMTRLMISDIVRDILGVNHVVEQELTKTRLPLTSPRHSSWYLRIRRRAAWAGLLACGIFYMSTESTTDELSPSTTIVCLLAIIMFFVVNNIANNALKAIESNRSYDILFPIAENLVLETNKPIALTKSVSTPVTQEGVAATGQLVEIDMRTNAISALDYDQVALESYLSTERSPLEISHEKAEKLLSRWAEYELNPIKFLEFPLLSDASDADVSAFHITMSDMKRYRSMLAQDSTFADEFAEAVVEAERAFLVAEGKAKKMGVSYLDADGQEKLSKAYPFVSIMSDEGASLNERTMAYDQATKILAGVIALPNETIKGLLSSTSTEPTKEKES